MKVGKQQQAENFSKEFTSAICFNLSVGLTTPLTYAAKSTPASSYLLINGCDKSCRMLNMLINFKKTKTIGKTQNAPERSLTSIIRPSHNQPLHIIYFKM
jgi:hypothetical protein